MKSQATPQQTFAALQKNASARLIDVREPEEYIVEHADSAELFSLSEWPHNFLASNLPLDSELYIICRSGGRSAAAIVVLQGKGYTNLTNVAGGTNEWKQQQLPLV